ncbi:hypothetical protein pb186bvf_010202 [Paramecium bursaria]
MNRAKTPSTAAVTKILQSSKGFTSTNQSFYLGRDNKSKKNTQEIKKQSRTLHTIDNEKNSRRIYRGFSYYENKNNEELKPIIQTQILKVFDEDNIQIRDEPINQNETFIKHSKYYELITNQTKEFNKKLDVVYDQSSHYLAQIKAEYKDLYNYNEDKLTYDQLLFLENELKLDDHERNYQELDQIIVKNQFFKRLDVGVRYGIMEQCKIEHKTIGDVLFDSQKSSRRTFIILSGSCSLQVSYKIKDSLIPIHILSYFDGQYISQENLANKGDQKAEFELINKLKSHPSYKRWENQFKPSQIVNSKIIVQENSYFISIQSDRFQKILIDPNKDILDTKLKTLSKIKFLKLEEHKVLLPLATTIQLKNFQQGDYLIKKGKTLDKLIIVNEGIFDVVVELRIRRYLKSEMIKQKLKQFTFNRSYGDYCERLPPKDPSDQSYMIHFCNQSFDDAAKSYQYGHKKREGDKLVYTHLQVVQSLKSGDVIGGRYILGNTEGIPSINYDARLSIVTSSVSAQIYFIDYKQFLSLPDQLQNKIQQGLTQINEFDDFDVRTLTNEILQWDQEKEKQVLNIAKEKQRKFKL